MNVDYGGMVQPSQQNVAIYLKGLSGDLTREV